MRITPHDNLDSYFAQIQAQPMLTIEEEADLARRWRDKGDRRAANRLVESHLRLVVRMARRMTGYGLPVSDLIAEGNLGLLRAVETFDPERGLRFATYALWWVKAAMFDYVLKFSGPVRMGMTPERKRLFFKLREAAAKIVQDGRGRLSDADAERVASMLNVRVDQVREMEQMLGQRAQSLNTPLREDSDTTLMDVLPDTGPNQEERLGERQELSQRRKLLAEAWEHLSERERDIISERALREEPLRLEDLAQRYGISRERVRQIEAAAMGKLRKWAMAAEARLGGARLLPST